MSGTRSTFKLRKIGDSYLIVVPKELVDTCDLHDKKFIIDYDFDNDENFIIKYILLED